MRDLRALVTTRRSLLLGGGAALAGAVLVGPTLAQTTQNAPTDATPTAPTTASPAATAAATAPTTAQGLYQDFVGKLAKNLGISDTTKVATAIKTSLDQMVDEQLAAGRISADEATRLKQAIAAGNFPSNLLAALARRAQIGRGPFRRGPIFGPRQRPVRPGRRQAPTTPKPTTPPSTTPTPSGTPTV